MVKQFDIQKRSVLYCSFPFLGPLFRKQRTVWWEFGTHGLTREHLEANESILGKKAYYCRAVLSVLKEK